MAHKVALPDVSNREQTGPGQQWHLEPIAHLTSARVSATWKDQGWGNQKGRLWARILSVDGKVLRGWGCLHDSSLRAPHDWENIEGAVPEEFFSGQVTNPDWCLQSSERVGEQIRVVGDPAARIATARYGVFDDGEEKFHDIKDELVRALSAGKEVNAYPWEGAVELFGDPCPGKSKEIRVTLTEETVYEPMLCTPDDANLELSFEVGGGGGHSLHIKDAELIIQKRVKPIQLFARASANDTWVIEAVNLGGDTVAEITVNPTDSWEAVKKQLPEDGRFFHEGEDVSGNDPAMAMQDMCKLSESVK